jgi:hypothetical protein
MTDTIQALLEVVHIRPKPGMRDKLLALRAKFLSEFREKTPGTISCSLNELADGSFLELVYWTDQASLEAVDEEHPMLEEWYGMADILWMETGKPVDA